MKNKKILILVIILCLIVLSITIYAAFFRKKIVYDDGETPLKLDERIELDTSIDYLTEYKDNIINEDITSLDYDIITDNWSLYGKIYLDNEKYPHISNTNTNQDYKFMDVKFKSLYLVIGIGTEKLEAYGITLDGEVYRFILDLPSIKDIKFYKMKYISNAVKFTNLKVEFYECKILGAVVLGEDNKMYDVDSGLLYAPGYMKLFDKYIVFYDDTIATYDGRRLLDYDNYYVEIAGFIKYEDTDKFLPNSNGILIVDKSGFLMYLYDNDLYMFDKAGDYFENDPENNTVNITFFDKTKKTLKGYFKYYIEEDVTVETENYNENE